MNVQPTQPKVQTDEKRPGNIFIFQQSKHLLASIRGRQIRTIYGNIKMVNVVNYTR